jgi:hypothetical protein
MSTAGAASLHHDAAGSRFSDASVRQLIERKILPAKQILKFAPWTIERAHLTLPRRPPHPNGPPLPIARNQQRPSPYVY